MQALKITAALLGCLVVGSCGWLGTSCASRVYQNYLFLDAARESAIRQQQQQQTPRQAPPPTPPQ